MNWSIWVLEHLQTRTHPLQKPTAHPPVEKEHDTASSVQQQGHVSVCAGRGELYAERASPRSEKRPLPGGPVLGEGVWCMGFVRQER